MGGVFNGGGAPLGHAVVIRKGRASLQERSRIAETLANPPFHGFAALGNISKTRKMASSKSLLRD
jgi:hypothetical protein